MAPTFVPPPRRHVWDDPFPGYKACVRCGVSAEDDFEVGCMAGEGTNPRGFVGVALTPAEQDLARRRGLDAEDAWLQKRDALYGARLPGPEAESFLRGLESAALHHWRGLADPRRPPALPRRRQHRFPRSGGACSSCGAPPIVDPEARVGCRTRGFTAFDYILVALTPAEQAVARRDGRPPGDALRDKITTLGLPASWNEVFLEAGEDRDLEDFLVARERLEHEALVRWREMSSSKVPARVSKRRSR